MKKLFLILIIICAVISAHSQSIDSLIHLLNNTKEDSTRVILLGRLSQKYRVKNPDTAMLLAQEGLALALKTNFREGEATLLSNISDLYLSAGNYTEALEAELQSLDIYEKHIPQKASEALHAIALLFLFHELDLSYHELTTIDQHELRLSLSFFLKENEALNIYPDEEGLLWNLIDIAKIYALLQISDSSQLYLEKANAVAEHFYQNNLAGEYLNTLGDLYTYRHMDNEAFIYYYQSIPDLIEKKDYREICESYIGLARVFKNLGKPDSSIYYAKQSLQIARERGVLLARYNATSFLTTLYKSLHNIDSAFLYQELSTQIHDSIFGEKKVKEFQNIRFSKQLREREMEAVKATYRSRLNVYALLAGLLILLLVAGGLWRKNIFKQKSYAVLKKQKEEIDIQKEKVELTLTELKSTQSQLIQSAKMASLGELTAGIAHEIQNPLNFVNNFSEVNAELITEMKDDLAKGNFGDAKTIADHIDDNEKKIIFHGKRADAIVKGMLQHSRTSSGVKEPTDINALADEYLRLAYHGLRAKDKSFNAINKTEFDASIGNVNVIPQDIGRVILNLITNAFYAVSERKKQQREAPMPDGQEYEPTVTVSTKLIIPPSGGPRGAEIRVKDNGNGIPAKVLDKIFQPFFTTKPTGQGTGLGLSMSYDIVKAHGGELTVQTKEGEGSEFIIQLPVV